METIFIENVPSLSLYTQVREVQEKKSVAETCRIIPHLGNNHGGPM